MPDQWDYRTHRRALCTGVHGCYFRDGRQGAAADSCVMLVNFIRKKADLMLRLLQNHLENQAVWAMLRELARIADQAVITDQFLIIARTIIRNSMRCARVMATGA